MASADVVMKVRLDATPLLEQAVALLFAGGMRSDEIQARVRDLCDAHNAALPKLSKVVEGAGESTYRERHHDEPRGAEFIGDHGVMQPMTGAVLPGTRKISEEDMAREQELRRDLSDLKRVRGEVEGKPIVISDSEQYEAGKISEEQEPDENEVTYP
jgi:hypothetical protein